MCAHGWAGKFCEADAIPACRNDSGFALACTTRQQPLPCACVRQCIAAGAFAPHMREPWAAPVCSWRGEYVAWKLDRAGGGVQRASRAAEHPLRGASKASHHWWDGQYESWTCFNGCSGRGACIRGSCVCTASFYGPGCAHSLHDAREAAAPASRLRLFVYDLPALITGRRSYGSDWDKAHIFSTAQASVCMCTMCHVHSMRTKCTACAPRAHYCTSRAAQRAFVPALLRDAASLTADPARADLFVVPAAATNMEAVGDYYRHLLRHVRRAWPYWNASGGADHVWLCSADHGGGVLAATPGVRDGLALAHYFKGRMRPSHLVYAPLLRGATAVAQRAYAGFGTRGWHAAEESRRSGVRLFFAGNFALSDLFYSEGVRQALHALRNTTGFRIVARSDTYAADYRNARFCAAPLGEGCAARPRRPATPPRPVRLTIHVFRAAPWLRPQF